MAHEVRRLPRYKTAIVSQYLGPKGELIHDSTTDELVLQNGSRGGVRMVKKSDFDALAARVAALENK